jgi:hypothetical protein
MSNRHPNLYRPAAWLLESEPKFALRLERHQFRSLLPWLAAAGLFLGLILWQRVQVRQLGYELNQLRATRDDLAYTQSRLNNRLRELVSLPYAEKVARQQLGMNNIDPRQVLYLRDPAQAASWPVALWRKVGRYFSGE